MAKVAETSRRLQTPGDLSAVRSHAKSEQSASLPSLDLSDVHRWDEP